MIVVDAWEAPHVVVDVWEAEGFLLMRFLLMRGRHHSSTPVFKEMGRTALVRVVCVVTAHLSLYRYVREYA